MDIPAVLATVGLAVLGLVGYVVLDVLGMTVVEGAADAVGRRRTCAGHRHCGARRGGVRAARRVVATGGCAEAPLRRVRPQTGTKKG